jgi:glycosidase
MKTKIDLSVPGPRREFHVSRGARESYGLTGTPFSLAGHVVFDDIRIAREFAMRLNAVRRAAVHPDRAVHAGDVYAIGLIDEVFHYVIAQYANQYGADIFPKLEEHLRASLGDTAIDRLLEVFSDRFPTVACYEQTETPQESLDRDVDGISGRHVALEEILVLFVGNRNPAYSPLIELFDEQVIAIDTAYEEVTAAIAAFFADQPSFGPDDQTLVEMLRTPAIEHPDDLHAQLDFIRTRWSGLIAPFLDRLLRSVGVLAEERKARFAGPGEARILEFDGDEEDYARFSQDREWMPRAVILAKSTLVWLDQLSRSYGREIRTLDAVPDEEIDRIAVQGFTGLWLIGLWQRSTASRRIKNLCGNPDAEASAYSLYDYDIAAELGGWNALDTLRRRLWQRGIRIASDMVPNHTGIDSKWIHEHPDWFIGLDHPPFPGYSFNGENLSTNPGVGIYLEDHYYDRSDAAVVFKRVDHTTGHERFIYHGNDGTSMPWNDTAQLDYLNPEVRATVIDTILHVARNFPIIRFDAAMTLAKKHIQRLWFPQPGQGGDIPSRAEHGLTQQEFDAAIPIEFWREVVDRVAAELPDTLLLAEAFWMMEGFFVRTLGMHRVYNSAFMNMLKNEDNDKYRRTIKNTIEYDPEILKRFVNFMNNPDEDTAIAQFGSGDKYFGVATLMVTMPGLPMFGHGQIEGFAEKYGMEYRRAYWDETPNVDLIQRHGREIFPLMRRRHLFADARHFRLFDVYDHDGSVLPDLFAYTNRHGDERALVLYNNTYQRGAGWIHTSSAFADGESSLATEQLAVALAIEPSWDRYVIMREQRSDLWYIRNCGEIAERGLFLTLDGYQSQVYLDMYTVTDNEYSHYARLADHLNGAGTPDVERALKRLLLQPLHDAFRAFANSGLLRHLETALGATSGTVDWDHIAEQYEGFLRIAAQFCERTTGVEVATQLFRRYGDAFSRLTQLAKRAPKPISELVRAHLKTEREDGSLFVALLLLLPLDAFVSGDQTVTTRVAGFQALDQAAEWDLLDTLESVLAHLSETSTLPSWWRPLAEILIAHHNWWRYVTDVPKAKRAHAIAEILLSDPNVDAFLSIHVHEGVTWFNRESFQMLIDWLVVVAVWHEVVDTLATRKRITWKQIVDETDAIADLYSAWRKAEKKSEYRVDLFLNALETR